MQTDDHGKVRGPIAIDGPAASGKTSLGEALAAHLGWPLLDTGLMYRAFTLAAIRRDVSPGDPEACARLAESLKLGLAIDGLATRITLDGDDVTGLLRAPDIEALVSAYSAIGGVRTVLVALQREFAGRGAAILAGRDIGTDVLPGAPHKFFLDASQEARNARRASQALSATRPTGTVVADRDRVDQARAVSPLRPAADATIIDTTALTQGEVIALALERLGCARG